MAAKMKTKNAAVALVQAIQKPGAIGSVQEKPGSAASADVPQPFCASAGAASVASEDGKAEHRRLP